ncbi:MAG: hypothetical protein AABY86_04855, partial [Bdellovibrionota bacterium]
MKNEKRKIMRKIVAGVMALSINFTTSSSILMAQDSVLRQRIITTKIETARNNMLSSLESIDSRKVTKVVDQNL